MSDVVPPAVAAPGLEPRGPSQPPPARPPRQAGTKPNHRPATVSQLPSTPPAYTAARGIGGDKVAAA